MLAELNFYFFLKRAKGEHFLSLLHITQFSPKLKATTVYSKSHTGPWVVRIIPHDNQNQFGEMHEIYYISNWRFSTLKVCSRPYLGEGMMQRDKQSTETKRFVIFTEFLICGHSVIYYNLNLVKNGCSPRGTKLVK